MSMMSTTLSRTLAANRNSSTPREPARPSAHTFRQTIFQALPVLLEAVAMGTRHGAARHGTARRDTI